MNQKQSGISALNFVGHNNSSAIKAIFRAAREAELPLAVWRLPQQHEVNVMVSFDKPISVDRPDLEKLNRGFLIAPFNTKNTSALFLKSGFQTTFNLKNTYVEDDSSLSCTNDHFLNAVQKELKNTQAKTKYYHRHSDEPSSEKSGYIALIEKGIEAIQNKTFEKIVPARSTKVKLDNTFDLIEKYVQLCHAYPNAFVSIVSTLETGTWLGATPELLLEVNQSTFKTVALAGTQKRDNNKHHLSETAWTQKEIEEQALVSRYIINCFKKIRLREYEEKGPRTSVAGNLLHLKTEFEVDMKATNFSELGTVMLELLHPTSAVAGMPKEVALAFLEKHEDLDRALYSGYLGPVQQNKQTNIFVNLRCLQLLEKSAILYAGAGVTEDSNPEKELQETEMKFNTLLDILNNNS